MVVAKLIELILIMLVVPIEPPKFEVKVLVLEVKVLVVFRLTTAKLVPVAFVKKRLVMVPVSALSISEKKLVEVLFVVSRLVPVAFVNIRLLVLAFVELTSPKTGLLVN